MTYQKRDISLNPEQLEPRMMLSTVQLFAGGSEGGEEMQLQIDGVAVETWTLDEGGDERLFQTYTYETAADLNANQVRVAFLNDQYVPLLDIDRNVRLDAIEIDGQRFETEDPSVFSTGTWLPADQLQPGFRESEYLTNEGYFQFADDTPPSDGTVVINEIYYNPPDDQDGDAEFLELYNPGDSTADLSGMSFTGFDLTFANGTTLGAGQYAIVSPSIAIAEAQWGVTPIAEFAGGGLSGGGELIQLLAADGITVVDEVAYDDVSPWPGGPDGNGPSLELIDAASDNALAASWAASNGDPTPSAENSVTGTVPSPITDITVIPGTPLPNQAFNISANIGNASVATLTYKVGINGADQTVAMINISGDQWQAEIPGQEAGSLVRYRIDADVAVAPFAGDTINYFGVVVSPTDIVENTLPVFQYFVDPDQFEELTTTVLALTNTKIPVVIAYGDQVFDNATVRVRGGDFSRLNYPKKSLKFELPSGYAMDVGAEGSYLIDEFGIQADYGDWSVAAPDISWDVFNAETDSFTSSFFTRVEQNGDFWGVFRFQELYDGAWRTANGYDDSEFFKADGGGFGSSAKFDKKKPDDGDFTSINAINEIVTAPPSVSKTAWLYENVDVPNVINHMALSSIMRHDDQRVQNFYMAQDPETQLWSIVEWDLDRTWRNTDDTADPFTTPEPINHELMNSLWEVPEFQDMYWRRMQTLVDTYLGDDLLVDARTAVLNDIGATNSALDFAKWGRTDIFTSNYFIQDWQDAIDTRRDIFANEIRMPGTASGNYDIVINELHYNPAGTDAEFLELFNNSNESVDLSGWQIDGVGLTIDFGTTILPNEYVVFTDNYDAFRSQYAGNIYVGAQYSGGLKGSGELITLLDANGNVQDQVNYTDSAPWPEGPDGSGFTLSLTDPNLDNNLASSWTTSGAINGTPAADNGSTPIGSTITVRASGDEATELFSLQINGVTVDTFAVTGSYANYTYLASSIVLPEQVRIVFLNDNYDPGNGIDANLEVDWFEIDSFRIQAESQLVYSTGTWNSADGIVPGFGRGDELNVEGFFEYRIG